MVGFRIRQWLSELLFDIVVNRLLGLPILPRPLRWRVLRAIGMDVEPSSISPNVYIGTPRVRIREGVRIAREAYLDGADTILLRANAAIGPRAVIIAGAHEIGGPQSRCGPIAPQPVEIGEGVWLGAGALVMPGVTIGAGCVIAAGSVVARDCAPNGVYAGVPAKRVRDLDAGPAESSPPEALHRDAADARPR